MRKRIISVVLVASVFIAVFSCFACFTVSALDVSTGAALKSALADSTTTTINITADFTVTEQLVIPAVTGTANAVPKTVNGNGHTITMNYSADTAVILNYYASLSLVNITLDFINNPCNTGVYGFKLYKYSQIALYEVVYLKNWKGYDDLHPVIRSYGTTTVILGSCKFENCTRGIYAAGSAENGIAAVKCSDSLNANKWFVSGTAGKGIALRLGGYSSCNFLNGDWMFDNYEYGIHSISINGININTASTEVGFKISGCKNGIYQFSNAAEIKIAPSGIGADIAATHSGIYSETGSVRVTSSPVKISGGTYGIYTAQNAYLTSTNAYISGGITSNGFVRITNSTASVSAVSARNCIAVDSKTCLRVNQTNQAVITADGLTASLQIYENVTDGTGKNAVSFSDAALGVSYAGCGFTDGDKRLYMYGSGYSYKYPLVYRRGSTLKTLKNDVISSLPDGTTVKQLLDNFANPNAVKVYDGTAEITDKIYTGCTVKSINGALITDTLTLAVAGDVNGNGIITSTDYLMIKRAIAVPSSVQLTDAQNVAADIDCDSMLTVNDYAALKLYFKWQYSFPLSFTNSGIDMTDVYSTHTPFFSENKTYKLTAALKLIITGAAVNSVSYTTQQGSCSDGEYVYSCMANGNNGAVIHKIRIADWTTVSKSVPLAIDHANDLTYNSKTNKIIAVHNAPNYTNLSIINPATLTVEEKKTTTVNIYGIGYSASRDEYAVGISGSPESYAILDSNFKVMKIFKPNVLLDSYVHQGADADEDYVYFIQSKSGANNRILVYDWNGNLVKNLDVPLTIEGETLFHIGKDYYTVYNSSGGHIYKMDINS